METRTKTQQLQNESTDNKAELVTQVSNMDILPTVTEGVHHKMKHFFGSLPDDIQANTKELRCGIKYIPEEDCTVPYIELIGK